MLHVDGASNATGCGAGLMLAEPDGHAIEYALRFSFHASNNQAEYEALLAGLRIAKDLGVQQLRAFSDSQLVVNQVNGEYAAKDPTMVQYLKKVRALSSQLEHFEIIHVLRSENSRADALSRLATTALESLRHTFVEHLETPSIAEEAAEVRRLTLS